MGKKESTSRDILDIIIKNEEIEKVFEDEEWRENVADAAFIAALYTTPLNEDPKEVIRRVINYNVVKQFKTIFVNNAKPLPKVIVWRSGYSKVDAMYLFDNYIAQVFLIKESGNLKKFTLTVYADDKALRGLIKMWCKKYEELYQGLSITYKQSDKVKNRISICFE